MKITRLRVAQWRQFRQPLEIRDIAPGLNLYTGPNEAGKSTLVQAIRAAFFERYVSTTLKDLQPWGDTAATPSVEIDFETAGTAYRLRKSFLQRKRCELQAGVQQFDGESAEQHLAALLGFEFAGKGASKPQHQGIPGLLWIEQGSGQQIGEPLGHAVGHLRKALEQSLGEVAGSQGDDVIARVRAERDLLLTSGGRPRAALADAVKQHDDLVQALSDLDARIDGYRAQVDQLGTLRHEHAADEQARPWEALRTHQRDAEVRQAAVQTLKGQLDADRSALHQLAEHLRLVQEQLAGFDTQQAALQQRETALAAAQARVNAARAADTGRNAARLQAQAELDVANAALTRAQQADQRDTLAQNIEDAQARCSALAQALQKAQVEQAQLTQHMKEATQTEIAKADLERLREQQARIIELRIRQDAAATRLRYALQADATLRLGSDTLSGQGEKLITASTDLALPGIGTLQIVPGGADLVTLAHEEGQVAAAHRVALQRAGAATLVDAEARFESHQQSLRDLSHSKKLLDNLAPQGLDKLRAELAQQEARRTEAQSRLASLPQQDDAPVTEPLPQATRHQAAAARHQQSVAEQAAAARQALATAQAEFEAASREHDVLRRTLDDPLTKERRTQAGERLLAARADHSALQQRVTAREAAVAAARPDILAQDVERYRRSADDAERVHRDRGTRITLLQGKLEEAGAQGLEEERAGMAVRAEAARRRRDELQSRAAALSLLLDLLESRRQALTQRLQAPLHRHMRHYLQLLFPNATMEIGDDLQPGRLVRAGGAGGAGGPNTDAGSGHFDDLSYGAREQVGVIARLAYADLLKAAGRPTLIILDDALVHSDMQRLEQMKRVLFDAAQRHQVLLFTCHPAAWHGLGASAREIEGFRAGA
jgi:hypothetical protein